MLHGDAASSANDFRSDAGFGVDFQQQRVGDPAIDDVRLVDAGLAAR